MKLPNHFPSLVPLRHRLAEKEQVLLDADLTIQDLAEMHLRSNQPFDPSNYD